MDGKRLARMAGRQLGLFTRAQACQCGASAYQIRRRVQAGEWLEVMGSVLCLPGVTLTSKVLDRAAQLAVPGSIMAGPSAARLWKMPVPDGEPFLYVGRRSPRVPGIRYLFSSPDQRDLGWHGPALTTWRERTVFDCLRLLPEADASTLLDRALQRRWITVADLVDRIHRAPGRRDIRRVVGAVHGVLDGSRSIAERLATQLLRGAGIEGWAANRPIYDATGLIGIGDIVFDLLKLVIEIDGRAFHSDAATFQRDRARQNRLVAAGWTVLRFTWHDLTERPDHVIAQIAAAIRRLAR